MYNALRILGIIASLGIACVAWQVLGYSTAQRTEQQRAKLSGSVSQLWGRPQAQLGPSFAFAWTTKRDVERTEEKDGKKVLVHETVEDQHSEDMSAESTDAAAEIHLDQRLKGMTWYSLYGVHFQAKWRYVHHRKESGTLTIKLPFADAEAMYDDFRFVVDGHDSAASLRPADGAVAAALDVVPDQAVTFEVNYVTRGLDEWSYVPGAGVTSLEDFHLRVATDFTDIDYPASAMSPSARQRTADGWALDWDFKQVLTGHSMGVVMPARIQPGELASRLAFSAPISLLLFFLLLFVLSVLRGLDIHPVNYVALAAAFFSFHLLFAYLVDYLALAPAFAIASGTSIALVVSYLRLVVSTRFAFVEAALAQLVYQVGFSLAHFWDGYTGLTVSVLSVLTLFVLMELTGRIRWSRFMGEPAGSPASATTIRS